MPARSTRSTTKKATQPSGARSAPKNGASSRGKKRAAPQSEVEEPSGEEDGDDEDDDEDAYDENADLEDAESINSDNLDDDYDASPPKKGKKDATSPRKSNGKTSPTSRKSSSPRKKRKTTKDEDEDDLDMELGEGQEIVGKVVQAPKTGRVPPGQISQNTLDFLSLLKKPECNDREWFKLHEPVYRLAEQEWKDFVEVFTDVLVEEDPQIPHLPPRDVIHRIYRDIRFSNDKTPYKTGFSASFSRSGRKGVFAGYHVSVRPGESLIAAGSWCPAKNELATIRNNLLRSSARLRKIINSPTFVALFGDAKPDPLGGRSNIFGREDELKVAPKGIPKDHKDIDLLKCRSFAVVYQFTDKQVLQPEFKLELGHLVKILRPFVHCLNDLMTIQADDDSDEDDDGEEPEDDATDEVAELSGEDE